MKTIKMLVLQEDPDPTSQIIMTLENPGPFMKRHGDTNYICGKCGNVLLDSVDKGTVREIVIKCGKCRTFNSTAIT